MLCAKRFSAPFEDRITAVLSPGSRACEAAAATLVGVAPALAGSGLLIAGAAVFVVVAVGRATLAVAIGLANEVAADVAGVGAVEPTEFVVASVGTVVVAVESEAKDGAGTGAGAGRGTAGVGGLAELDDEAGCIPAKTNRRSIWGWATA
jgi:hypothetical protein